ALCARIDFFEFVENGGLAIQEVLFVGEEFSADLGIGMDALVLVIGLLVRVDDLGDAIEVPLDRTPGFAAVRRRRAAAPGLGLVLAFVAEDEMADVLLAET